MCDVNPTILKWIFTMYVQAGCEIVWVEGLGGVVIVNGWEGFGVWGGVNRILRIT